MIFAVELEAGPQHDQRHQRDGGDGIEKRDVDAERDVDHPEARQQQPGRDADHGRDGEPGREDDEARPEIVPQLAADDHAVGGLRDRGRRGEQHRVDAGADDIATAPAPARPRRRGCASVCSARRRRRSAATCWARERSAPAIVDRELRPAPTSRGLGGLRALRNSFQICARSSAKRGSARSALTSRGRPNGRSSISLMRPGRALITAMRSPSRIASSIEWVMNTMVLRSSAA